MEDEAAESSTDKAGRKATPVSMMVHNKAGGGRLDNSCYVRDNVQRAVVK